MVFAKVLAGTTAATFTGYVLVPTFRRKLDRNVLRPIRDYRAHLALENAIKTEEQFYGFLGDLGYGVARMFTIE